jgi:hypothetical protein
MEVGERDYISHTGRFGEEMKKSKEEMRKDHDSKTCFRCRLHALYEEIGFKHDNDAKFMYIAMAEACGHILQSLDIEDMMLFMSALQHFLNEGPSDDGSWQTKH